MPENAPYANALTKFMEEPESLRSFLERRKRELAAQVAALRGQIGPKEQELAEIELVIAALPPIGLLPQTSPPRGLLGNVEAEALSLLAFYNDTPLVLEMAARYQKMTIKELVVQAFLDHFPNGATAAQIRDFIRDAYGRDIEASSLRPQMHRLKSAGRLLFNPEGDIWNLDPRARLLYSRYDHPTSRKAMKELQDEPAAEE